MRGSEAVLIGARGDQRITAEEVAQRMDTINYEVTCALTGRVPRVYHYDGERQRAPRGQLGSAEASASAGFGALASDERAGARDRRSALAGRALGLSAARCATACSARPGADLDVVLDGDPGEGARAIAQAAKSAGTPAACFALSEEFGAWRVVAIPVDDRWRLAG